jgi:hypothetical protein
MMAQIFSKVGAAKRDLVMRDHLRSQIKNVLITSGLFVFSPKR